MDQNLGPRLLAKDTYRGAFALVVFKVSFSVHVLLIFSERRFSKHSPSIVMTLCHQTFFIGVPCDSPHKQLLGILKLLIIFFKTLTFNSSQRKT